MWDSFLHPRYETETWVQFLHHSNETEIWD